MHDFIVVETEDGLTVVEVLPGDSAEDVAVRYGGVIADPGPYKTYQDAEDAMLLIPQEEAEEEEPPEG